MLRVIWMANGENSEEEVGSKYREAVTAMVTSKTQPATQLDAKVQQLKQSLSGRFIEREMETVSLLAGLFSNEPVVLIGPPGTAKTKMIEELGKAVSAKYFYYLLQPFTEPDELLGPIDIKAYKKKALYKRSEKGGLQEANILFLDEPFKASSPVRNLLLDIILNKRYKNGDKHVALPVVGIYMAANELPSESEDAAFYDRLVIRDFVDYVSKKNRSQLLLRGKDVDSETRAENIGILSLDDVKTLQAEVNRRVVAAQHDTQLVDKYVAAMSELDEKEIGVSDRMRKKILRVAGAVSVVFGDKKVEAEHLATAIYLCAPRDKDDLKTVEDIIAKTEMSTAYRDYLKLENVYQDLANSYETVKSKAKEEGVSSQSFRGALADLAGTLDAAKKVQKEVEAGRLSGSAVYAGFSKLVPAVGAYVDETKKRLTAEPLQAPIQSRATSY